MIAVSYTHLDVYKRQKIECGVFKFDVLRKETYTDLIIPQESYHPVSHKMAPLNSFCYRAIKYLEDDSCKKEELKRIEEIAKKI